MPTFTTIKDNALNLRKKGLSYSEISHLTHISESTLSDWISHIKLSKSQQKRLNNKREINRKLGSKTLKDNRLEKTKRIIEQAYTEIKNLGLNDLKLIGIILYWAEGSKQKEHNPSKEVIFSNSDPDMIRVFLKWLKKCLDIEDEKIVFEIYIHRTYQKTSKQLAQYWSGITGYSPNKFNRIYFKKNKVHSYRKNKGENYFGVLRIRVRKSTDLNRRITGWIKGVCHEFIS